eukprot:6187008-Pleurochrysis_carterae.AAC.2
MRSSWTRAERLSDQWEQGVSMLPNILRRRPSRHSFLARACFPLPLPLLMTTFATHLPSYYLLSFTLFALAHADYLALAVVYSSTASASPPS